MLHLRPLALLIPLIVLGGCATNDARVPSLAPRSAEAIDPRVPIADRTDTSPADAAFGTRLDRLVVAGRSGLSAFERAMAAAERLAAVAGPRQSESWIAAQQALSGAIAERYPLTNALAAIDALAAERVAARGGMTPADQRQFDAATSALQPFDFRQAARVTAVQRRLGV